MKFGKRLRTLMAERGMTAEDLEHATGIPAESLAIWMSPEGIIRADTSLTNLIALCRLFGVSAAYLLGTSDERGVPAAYAPPRDFCKRLPAVLAKYGKTLPLTIRRTRLTSTHIRVWKTGGEPLASDILTLCAYLGCSPDELM